MGDRGLELFGLSCQAFLPSVISSFFTQNKGEGVGVGVGALLYRKIQLSKASHNSLQLKRLQIERLDMQSIHQENCPIEIDSNKLHWTFFVYLTHSNLKGHSQLMYICIRYHFVANVPITEIGSIQVFSKQMKIKENTAKIVGANFLDVL